MIELSFEQRRRLCLAMLTARRGLNRQSGGFLGQMACDPSPMTPKQREWFATLVERANLDGGDYE